MSMKEPYIIKSHNSLHGDCFVYHLPLEEVHERFPAKRKTPEEKAADEKQARSVRINAQLEYNMRQKRQF